MSSERSRLLEPELTRMSPMADGGDAPRPLWTIGLDRPAPNDRDNSKPYHSRPCAPRCSGVRRTSLGTSREALPDDADARRRHPFALDQSREIDSGRQPHPFADLRRVLTWAESADVARPELSTNDIR